LSAPATPADIGHFFGARIGDVRSWLDALGSKKLVDVECGGRKGLLALKKDTTELKRKAPTRLSEWPLRILPMWDAHLMAHANKTWLAPHGADEKRIWKAAAVVKPAVLVRGRIVATWSHKKKKKRLEVVVEPLVAWSAFRHGAGVRREAQALARHLELESVDVRWGP
jgi:hypothetical protein